MALGSLAFKGCSFIKKDDILSLFGYKDEYIGNIY